VTFVSEYVVIFGKYAERCWVCFFVYFFAFSAINDLVHLYDCKLISPFWSISLDRVTKNSCFTHVNG